MCIHTCGLKANLLQIMYPSCGLTLSSPVSMTCRLLNTLTTVSNPHIGLIWSGLVWCLPFWRLRTPGYEVLTPVKMYTMFMEVAFFCRGERYRVICTQRIQWTLCVGSGDCKDWPWSVVDLTVGNQLPLQHNKLIKGEAEIAVPSIFHGESTVRRFTPREGATAALNRWLGRSRRRSWRCGEEKKSLAPARNLVTVLTTVPRPRLSRWLMC